MKTLIIVDCQNDIVNIDGNFHINDAENIIKNIEEFVKNTDDVDDVILTMKSFPKDHYSFIENRGMNNSYCVVDTQGHKIVSSLNKVIKSKKFKHVNTIMYNTLKDQTENSPYHYSETINYRVVLKSAEDYAVIHNDDVIICGISDCKNMINSVYTLLKILGNDHVEIFKDGIITDDNKRFNNFIKEENINIVNI